MVKLLSSSNGAAIGQKTVLVLLVSLLPIVFSNATSISDLMAPEDPSRISRDLMSGLPLKDHQYHVTHSMKTDKERMTYIKKLMAAKAKEQQMVSKKGGKGVMPPLPGEGAGDKVKSTQKKYRLSLHSHVLIKVGEYNNITLHGVAWVPTPHPENPNEKFPLVVLPNSWATLDLEYIIPSATLAEKGYVTIGYETRGWYSSGGEIDVAGNKDRADASTVLDFLLSDERAKEWNINTSAVAFAGISYGAGISQMMAGYDRRVKTVASMSGWGDILKALYGYESVNIGAIDFLIETGNLVGKVPQYLIDMMHYLNNHTNLNIVEAFAKERSPSTFINAINARNKNGDRVSMFMSVNMGDNFFAPQHSISFWQQLDAPKMLLVNQGDHTEGETVGLLGVPDNHIWVAVGKWLDHELKGIDNGILTDPVKEPQVSVQAGNSIFSSDYISFPKGWPRSPKTAKWRDDNSGGVAGGPAGSVIVEYKLSARGGAYGPHYGGLNSNGMITRPRYNTDPSLNTISYSPLPGIGGGIYLISGLLSGLGYPVTAMLKKVPSKTAILYATPPLGRGMNNEMGSALGNNDAHGLGANRRDFFVQPSPKNKKNMKSAGGGPVSAAAATVCGSPEIRNFTFAPSAVWPGDEKKSFSDRWQLYAFLYDQDPSNEEGTLISDGAFTRYSDSNKHDGNDNVRIWQRPDGSTSVTIDSFVMRTVCHRILGGHQLVLGFALAYDKFFQPVFPSIIPPQSTSHLEVEIQYDAGSVLRVPFA